jgi:uncharacterized protein YndB with AHSA1/START domain
MAMTRHGSASIDLSNDCEVVIRRDFEAPISLVFEALTSPEHVRVWFSADGVPLHVCEIDLYVGGQYRFAWYAKEIECAFRGTFVEIDPPTRIVNTWVFERRPEAEAVETISLSEQDGVTTMTDRLAFKDRASRDANFGGDTQGVQRSFDYLEDLLAGLVAGPA